MFGEGEKITEGQTLAIEHVRITNKEPGEGYSIIVMRDASTEKKYHSFSAKIISQFVDAADDAGGIDVLNAMLKEEPLERTVKGMDTPNGRMLLLE